MIDAPFGCEVRTAQNGALYCRIHYSADPGKDKAWAAGQRKTIPYREWEREMEMNEDIYDGEPVFADYRSEKHCPGRLQSEMIPIVKGSEYIVGWDCGNTLQPAAVLIQVAPFPHQCHALIEMISPSGAPMSKFAPFVNQTLMRIIPQHWHAVKHVADETCDTRQGARGETAADVAREHGIVLHAISNIWEGRYSAVQDLLVDSIDDKTSRLLISGKGCPALKKGFEGAYKYENAPKGELYGAGAILLKPLKNSFSHVHDAFQAAAIEIKDRYFTKPADKAKHHSRYKDQHGVS